MQQLEISLFWPLTEQMPLELDYSDCEKPKAYTLAPVTGAIGYLTTNGGTYTTQIVGNFQIDADNTTFKTSKKPNIIRKMLFDVMGIKLENA